MRITIFLACTLLLSCSTSKKNCEQAPLTSLSPLSSTAPVPAEPSCAHDDKNFRCVTYVRNYDADTVTVNIPQVPALIGHEISIRVRGLDTPEIKTQNLCEKKAGQKAQKLVAEWLKNAKRIDLKEVGRDKYFRILANVEFDGQDLTHKLLEAKLAYPYQGGTKAKMNWCNQ